MPAALRSTRSASGSARTAGSTRTAASQRAASTQRTAGTARTAASTRSSANPAKSRPRTESAASARPELHVIQGRKKSLDAQAVTDGFQRLLSWILNRRSPFITTVVAALFLMGTLLGTLALRTQMIENSFEATRLNRSIAMLTQDSQTYESELNRLEAQLPQKAQEMGMVPQSGSISIDLQGYQPSDAASDGAASGNAANGTTGSANGTADASNTTAEGR